MDLRAVVDPGIESGIAHGRLLLAFADAVIGTDHARLNDVRADLVKALSPGALVQSAAIVANFAMNDRAANALGIVLEPMFVRGSVDFRPALGIDSYPSARNTLRD